MLCKSTHRGGICLILCKKEKPNYGSSLQKYCRINILSLFLKWSNDVAPATNMQCSGQNSGHGWDGFHIQ